MVAVEFTLTAGDRYKGDQSMIRQLEALSGLTNPESLFVGLRDGYLHDYQH